MRIEQKRIRKVCTVQNAARGRTACEHSAARTAQGFCSQSGGASMWLVLVFTVLFLAVLASMMGRQKPAMRESGPADAPRMRTQEALQDRTPPVQVREEREQALPESRPAPRPQVRGLREPGVSQDPAGEMPKRRPRSRVIDRRPPGIDSEPEDYPDSSAGGLDEGGFWLDEGGFEDADVSGSADQATPA